MTRLDRFTESIHNRMTDQIRRMPKWLAALITAGCIAGLAFLAVSPMTNGGLLP